MLVGEILKELRQWNDKAMTSALKRRANRERSIFKRVCSWEN